MKTHFLVLADSDFGTPISLSRSCDQLFSEDAAHAIAEEFGEDEVTFLYRLEAVYRPAQSREIPEYLVPTDAQVAPWDDDTTIKARFTDNNFGGTD